MGEAVGTIPEQVQAAAEGIVRNLPDFKKDPKVPERDPRNIVKGLLQREFLPIALDQVVSGGGGPGLTSPEALVTAAVDRHATVLPAQLVETVRTTYKPPQPEGSKRDWHQEGLAILRDGMKHPVTQVSQGIIGISPQIRTVMAKKAFAE